MLPAMAALASELGIWLLIGSIGVRASDGRINNRSYMLRPDGGIAARYDKIHMFDVDLGPGKVYRESATIAPGDTGGDRALRRRQHRSFDLLRPALCRVSTAPMRRLARRCWRRRQPSPA